jgi:hypothetical protein
MPTLSRTKISTKPCWLAWGRGRAATVTYCRAVYLIALSSRLLMIWLTAGNRKTFVLSGACRLPLMSLARASGSSESTQSVTRRS